MAVGAALVAFAAVVVDGGVAGLRTSLLLLQRKVQVFSINTGFLVEKLEKP